MPSSKREQLAAVQHEIWSHWLRYMFTQCEEEACEYIEQESFLVIPKDKVARWKRQMETPYAKLSEEEQQSDLEQADKVLAVLRHRNS